MVLVLLLAPVGATEAQMYKCVDARGVTHYADKPLPGCRGAMVDIRSSPPLSGTLASPSEDLARQDADLRRRQIERERAEEKEKRALDARCARLRRQLGLLSSDRRIAAFDAKGERVFVDDEQRERRLAEVRAELQSCP